MTLLRDQPEQGGARVVIFAPQTERGGSRVLPPRGDRQQRLDAGRHHRGEIGHAVVGQFQPPATDIHFRR